MKSVNDIIYFVKNDKIATATIKGISVITGEVKSIDSDFNTPEGESKTMYYYGGYNSVDANKTHDSMESLINSLTNEIIMI